MYIIKCFNSENYTIIKDALSEDIKVSLFNSYYKGYVKHLDKLLEDYDVVLEYPRGMEEEAGWIVGRVNKRYLSRLKVELLDSIYEQKYTNEIVVIGEGYDER